MRSPPLSWVVSFGFLIFRFFPNTKDYHVRNEGYRPSNVQRLYTVIEKDINIVAQHVVVEKQVTRYNPAVFDTLNKDFHAGRKLNCQARFMIFKTIEEPTKYLLSRENWPLECIASIDGSTVHWPLRSEFSLLF